MYFGATEKTVTIDQRVAGVKLLVMPPIATGSDAS
jgi:hypothetical protein